MQAITVHSRVASDGSLQLQLPDELKDHDVQIAEIALTHNLESIRITLQPLEQ